MANKNEETILEIQIAPQNDEITLDSTGYLIAIASGLLSGVVDAFVAKGFNLDDAQESGARQIEFFVRFVGKREGIASNEIERIVKGLEDHHPFAGDKLTAEFGGGRQHHLRDFSHHASPLGLVCSLFTQFTGKAIGVKTDGSFQVVSISQEVIAAAAARGNVLIGSTLQEKLYLGTVQWFLHLVSDMAGSSSSIGESGGTGIPGPLMSLVRSFASLPLVRDLVAGQDPQGREYTVSRLASKLFNGTFLGEHDELGRPIKTELRRFDLRMEVGLFEQLGSQAFPVLLNEIVIRVVYALRRLFEQLKNMELYEGTSSMSLKVFDEIDWSKIRPWGNRSIDRMLTVATGVFTATDVAESITRSVLSKGNQPLLGRVNVVGVGRFAVAMGTEFGYVLEDVGGPFALISAMGDCLAKAASIDEIAQKVVDTVGMGQPAEYAYAFMQFVEAAKGAAVGAAMPIPGAMALSSQIICRAIKEFCCGSIAGPEFVLIVARDAIPLLVASFAQNAPELLMMPGAMPAAVWTGISYSCLMETVNLVQEAYHDYQQAHAIRLATEEICREKLAEAVEARIQLRDLAAHYLGEQSQVFNEGLIAMDEVLGIDDNAFILANMKMQEALGVEAAFHSVKEFDDLMDSEDDFRL